jgi:penicillin-binding protein 1A
MLAMLAGVGVVVAQTELPPFRALDQASYICAANDASGPGTCTPETAMTRLQSDEGNRTIIALDEVPDVVVQAVLAMEDRDFYEHDGVNPTGIMRAMFQNVKSRSVQQGGSTITQQYVLNSFSLAREGGIARKLKEAVLSIKLEQQMSKDEILEGYLNTIFFGRGAYGIAAASRAYFGIEVQQITDPGQAAFLAGLIRAPNYAEPTEHPDEAARRRKTGLVAMVEEGYITQEQADTADAIPVADPWITPLSTVRQTDTLKGAHEDDYLATDYLAPYIERELNAIDPERFTEDMIRGGGLRVYTSLNYDLQRAAIQAVTNNLNEPDDPATPEIEGDPDAALVAVDGDGLVRAMVPSRRPFAAGIHENNYALLGHEPGSTFKPIVLAEALRQNYSASSRFEAPGRMEFAQWPDPATGNPWKVSNYSDAGEAQVMDMMEATAQSSNTAYAQLMLALGTDSVDTDGDGAPNAAKGPAAVAALAESMGVGGGDIPDDQTQPAMVLGTFHATPLEMAGVYSTFMNRGVYKEPSIITRVEQVDEDGNVNVLYERRVEEKQVLSEKQADLVTHALQGVVAEGGTGANAAIGDRPVAGKTGTSQQNRNAWFTGFVPGLTASVWMGYPDNTYDDPSTPEVEHNLWPMNDDGRLVHGRAATGGSIPATIWREFMEIAAANLTGDFSPVTPEDIAGGTVLNKDLRTEAEQPPPTEPGPGFPGGPDWPLPDIPLPDRPGRGDSTTTTTSPPTTSPPTTTQTTEPPVTIAPPGPPGNGNG